MKSLYKLLLIGSCMLSMISCEDFLEKNPLDQISSQTFWKTKADAEMGLAGVYASLTQYGYADGNYNFNRVDWDGMTDNCFTNYGHGNIMNLSRGIIEATSGGMVSSIYSQSYKGISRCNVFLQNIQKVSMDEGIKNQFIGEVLFLRSYFYFNLTEFYGGVPLYTEPPTIESSMVQQKTKQEVVAQIIADLDKAIGYLPDAAYDGHVTKGSALALKSKVLLHNEKWAEAAASANQVIQSGKFSLHSNYPDLFTVAGQIKNSEIMFSTRYLNPDNYAFYGPDIEWGWWNTINILPDLVNAYQCIDGKPITESPLYNPAKPRENRDPRLGYTVRFDGAGEFIGGTWDNGYISETGYVPKKYIEVKNVPINYSTKSEQDFIHLRFADVLLMYAEAKNEANGPDASVYKAINDIRERVKMPALPDGLSKDQMRERIRYERRIELAMEGYRYLDLKRWRIAEKIIPGIVDPGGVKRAFDSSKHYLFPFPQSEIDVNKELKQNPGY